MENLEDLRKELNSLKERVDSLESLIMVEQAGILEIKKLIEHLDPEKLVETRESLSLLIGEKLSETTKKIETTIEEIQEKIQNLSEELKEVKEELENVKTSIRMTSQESPELVKIIHELQKSMENVKGKINLHESLKERIEKLEEELLRLSRKLEISDKTLVIE